MKMLGALLLLILSLNAQRVGSIPLSDPSDSGATLCAAISGLPAGPYTYHGVFRYRNLGSWTRMTWFKGREERLERIVQVTWKDGDLHIDLNRSGESPEYIKEAARKARDAVESGAIAESTRPCTADEIARLSY